MIIYKILCEEESNTNTVLYQSQVSCNFNNDNCGWITNNYVDNE